MVTSQPYLPTPASLADILWVAAGAALTLCLAMALVYWVGQEWRAMDAKLKPPAPPAPPAGGAPPPGPAAPPPT